MTPQLNKEYSARDMAELYQALSEHWFLLEVLQKSAGGRPEKLRLVRFARDKQELLDYLMDVDEKWSWDKNYIFVYADPGKECDLV